MILDLLPEKAFILMAIEGEGKAQHFLQISGRLNVGYARFSPLSSCLRWWKVNKTNNTWQDGIIFISLYLNQTNAFSHTLNWKRTLEVHKNGEREEARARAQAPCRQGHSLQGKQRPEKALHLFAILKPARSKSSRGSYGAYNFLQPFQSVYFFAHTKCHASKSSGPESKQLQSKFKLWVIKNETLYVLGHMLGQFYME